MRGIPHQRFKLPNTASTFALTRDHAALSFSCRFVSGRFLAPLNRILDAIPRAFSMRRRAFDAYALSA